MNPPSIDTIKRLCAAAFHITLLDMDSRRRDERAVMARHGAIWLARHLTAMSTPQIGRHFGGRDHTTILHAIARMNTRLEDAEPGTELIVQLFCQLKLPPNLLQPAQEAA